MEDPLPDFDTIAGEMSSGRPVPAFETLPKAFLEEAIPRDVLARIRTERGFALLVVAPTPAWIEPLATAAAELRSWTSVYVGDVTARKPPSSDMIASKLASGLSVVAIASSPERQLPACMAAAADARVEPSFVGNGSIALAIQAATGELPDVLPPRIAAGLDYHDLIAAIRMGTTAADCVARLLAAARAQGSEQAPGTVAPLESLSGYGAAQEWGMRLLADLGEWRAGRIAFASIDRRVVLASAPGLGKTSFVRSLAASAGLPLVATTVAEWFSVSDGYLGGVLREVDRVFAKAAAQAPCVLLIDELDALPGRANTGRNSDFWAPVITRLLVLLDGATSGPANRLIVVGATNHPERLDPALVRPGRMNRIIAIRPPDVAALAGILRQHLGADLAGADLRAAARLALGATGAQVADWVGTARDAARRRGEPMVLADLTGAIAPPDDRPAGDLFRTAVHEAGHACVAHWIWPGSVRSVSIVVRGTAAGLTAVEPRRELSPTRAMIEDRVLAFLAGRAAEIAILGSASVGAGGGGRSDLALATRELGALHASHGLGVSPLHLADRDDVQEALTRTPALRRAVTRDLDRLQRRALRATRRMRPSIVGVARELIARRVMDGDEFLAAFERSRR